jgi:hypothetical protein
LCRAGRLSQGGTNIWQGAARNTSDKFIPTAAHALYTRARSTEMPGVRVPYTLRIERTADLIGLEKDLRVLLQCQGRTCAFLQSAEYAALKFDVCHALRGARRADASERTIYVPGSTLCIQVSADGLSIVIQSKATALVPNTRNSSGKTAMELQFSAHNANQTTTTTTPSSPHVRKRARLLLGEAAAAATDDASLSTTSPPPPSSSLLSDDDNDNEEHDEEEAAAARMPIGRAGRPSKKVVEWGLRAKEGHFAARLKERADSFDCIRRAALIDRPACDDADEFC